MPTRWNMDRWFQNEDGTYTRERRGMVVEENGAKAEVEVVEPEVEAVEEEYVEGYDATPAAEELAGELGIDLATVEGTGVEGRITKADVEEAASK